MDERYTFHFLLVNGYLSLKLLPGLLRCESLLTQEDVGILEREKAGYTSPDKLSALVAVVIWPQKICIQIIGKGCVNGCLGGDEDLVAHQVEVVCAPVDDSWDVVVQISL